MAFDLTYPTNLNRFRTRRNEVKYLYPLIDSLPTKASCLKTAQSLLCVGPGPGEYEIELIERCLPALRSIAGVEIDDYCANELEKNLRKRFDGKLKWTIYRESMVDFDSDDKFDVIFISHCLYNMTKQERKEFFGKLFKKWLTPSGVMIMIHMSNKYGSDGKSQNVMQNLHVMLKHRMEKLSEVEEVLEEAEEMGGKVVSSERYQCQMDFSDFGDDITFIFNLSANPPITSDEMRKAIEDLKLKDGIGQYFARLVVMSK